MLKVYELDKYPWLPGIARRLRARLIASRIVASCHLSRR